MADVIFVSGNCGKSIFSYYLAKQFADEGKRTVVLFTDREKTATGLFYFKRFSANSSLGKLLSLPKIEKDDVFTNLLVLNERLGYLSYRQGESDMDYPKVTRRQVNDLLGVLEDICDQVIVDSERALNRIDRYLLELTNPTVIQITTADRRGISYRACARQTDGEIPILLELCQNHPTADVLRTFSKRPYRLPLCKELHRLYNDLEITDIKTPKGYRKLFEKLREDGRL